MWVQFKNSRERVVSAKGLIILIRFESKASEWCDQLCTKRVISKDRIYMTAGDRGVASSDRGKWSNYIMILNNAVQDPV